MSDMGDGSASGGKADGCLATRESRYVLLTKLTYFHSVSDALLALSRK